MLAVVVLHYNQDMQNGMVRLGFLVEVMKVVEMVERHMVSVYFYSFLHLQQ